MKRLSIPILFCFSFASTSFALDHVATKDGGMLTGTISQITKDTLILNTDYAGEITLQRDKILGFSSEQPLPFRLNSGTTLSGTVQHQAQGELAIKAADTGLTTQLDAISEGWSLGQEYPQIVRLEEEHNAALRG